MNKIFNLVNLKSKRIYITIIILCISNFTFSQSFNVTSFNSSMSWTSYYNAQTPFGLGHTSNDQREFVIYNANTHDNYDIKVYVADATAHPLIQYQVNEATYDNSNNYLSGYGASGNTLFPNDCHVKSADVSIIQANSTFYLVVAYYSDNHYQINPNYYAGCNCYPYIGTNVLQNGYWWYQPNIVAGYYVDFYEWDMTNQLFYPVGFGSSNSSTHFLSLYSGSGTQQIRLDANKSDNVVITFDDGNNIMLNAVKGGGSYPTLANVSSLAADPSSLNGNTLPDIAINDNDYCYITSFEQATNNLNISKIKFSQLYTDLLASLGTYSSGIIPRPVTIGISFIGAAIACPNNNIAEAFAVSYIDGNTVYSLAIDGPTTDIFPPNSNMISPIALTTNPIVNYSDPAVCYYNNGQIKMGWITDETISGVSTSGTSAIGVYCNPDGTVETAPHNDFYVIDDLQTGIGGQKGISFCGRYNTNDFMWYSFSNVDKRNVLSGSGQYGMQSLRQSNTNATNQQQSIAEIDNSNAGYIYPNIIKQSAIIGFKNPMDKLCKLTMVDMMGKTILQTDYASVDEMNHQLNSQLSSLSAGMYLFEVSTNDNQFHYTDKLIKID